MSCRCLGVNRIVFIAPSRQPHGSTHRGVSPPASFGNCRKFWTGETINYAVSTLHHQHGDRPMATAGKKSEFLLDLLRSNPDAGEKDAVAAWQQAGNEGTISPTS